uniref:Uncharacterized protein n=1 Tax=Plectus sambesii TaxID=2011161 RepID=A0A914VEL8_9BILA
MPASLCARRKYFVIGATFVLAAFYAIFVLRSRWLLKDLDSASAQLEMDIADTRPLFCDNPFQSFTRFDDADLSDCAFIGEQRMPTSSAGSNEMACRKLCIDEARAARRHGKSPCAMITFRRKGLILCGGFGRSLAFCESGSSSIPTRAELVKDTGRT